jgi:DNA-binding CsgD family transcriptional regulator
MNLLAHKEEGKTFLRVSFESLLIKFSRLPTRNTYEEMKDIYKKAKQKKLDIEYDIASDLIKVTTELKFHEETIIWLKKVHEIEIAREHNKYKQEIDKIEIVQKIEQLEAEKLSFEEQANKLRSDLKIKSKETELLAIQLAKKGSFLASLTKHLSEMKGNSEQNSDVAITKVIEYINSVRHKDKEFERLEDRARVLHHDFVVLLSKSHYRLTETEKKICLLFRLGLDTHDIANVLFASVRTIETHCLRIRKKMRIPQTARVGAFLRDFQTS